VKEKGDKMKKQFFNYNLLLLLFLTCFSINAGAQNIKPEAKLQQYTIRIGDQTRFFLSVHQPVKEHINFPNLTDTLTGKVQIININKPDTAFDANDKSQATITESYTITSFDAGTYKIPSYSFGSAGGVLKSNELTLQVQTVKVDTTKGIYDIKQPIKVSYTFVDWFKDNWYWVIIPLLLIVAVIGFIVYLKNRPKPQPIVKVVKPTVPAHIIALGKLTEIQGKKLWQQEQTKQYYIELSDVLREYLENRYHLKTHEKTTDEILSDLKRIEIADENKGMLKQILVLSDLVKFAKEKPLPVENEQTLEQAINFVKNTQQVVVKVNTEGGSPDV
jgi:hypothetical protein